MKFIKAVCLALSYGPELEVLLKGPELEVLLKGLLEAKEDAERLARLDYLDLCKKHQPRSVGSHYAEHNCDYCQALKKLESVKC